MRLPRPRTREQADSAIALINVVFLMLIFFLIAGSIAPPLDPSVRLVTTDRSEPAGPPDALFVRRDGALSAGGRPTTVAAFVRRLNDAEPPVTAVKLAPDRDLAATTLIDVVADIRAAGIDHINIVTERGRR